MKEVNHNNNAGNSARQIALKYRFKRKIICFGGIFIIFFIVYLHTNNMNNIYIGLGAIIVMSLVDKIIEKIADNAYNHEKKARKGEKAEIQVASILNNVKGDKIIFHDINKGRGDIDHIVMSKEHGLFLIETKSHHGNITVENNMILINGKMPEKDFIKQTLRNISWLKEQIKKNTGLDVWVEAIIVFTNGFVKEWKPVNGIKIRNAKYLLKTIEESKSNKYIINKLYQICSEGKQIW